MNRCFLNITNIVEREQETVLCRNPMRNKPIMVTAVQTISSDVNKTFFLEIKTRPRPKPSRPRPRPRP